MSVLIICGVFLASPICYAGYEIRAVFKDFASARPAQYTTVLRLEGGKANINTSQFTGEATELLYGAGDRIIRLINRSSAEYSELNEESLGRAADMVQSTLDYVREKVSGESQASMAQERAPVISEVKGAWTVSGLTCRRYKVTYGNQMSQDIWMADWAATGIKNTDFKVVNLLAASYDRLMKSSELMPAMGFMVNIPTRGFNQLNGFPVLIKQYRKGALQYEILLSRPAIKKLPASLFQIPSGYRKVWF
jgi:hypothetical protein